MAGVLGFLLIGAVAAIVGLMTKLNMVEAELRSARAWLDSEYAGEEIADEAAAYLAYKEDGGVL